MLVAPTALATRRPRSRYSAGSPSFWVIGCRPGADAAHTGVDRDPQALGMLPDLFQMGRIEAFIIVEAGDLDGIELQAGGVVEELDRLPFQGADRVRVEPELDAALGRSRGRQSRRRRCRFQERAPKHSHCYISVRPREGH